MLKKKLGGGLLLSYDKVKKREMDAKSGSVLPTTPRIKGMSMVRYNECNGITNGKFSSSMRYHTRLLKYSSLLTK